MTQNQGLQTLPETHDAGIGTSPEREFVREVKSARELSEAPPQQLESID